MAYVLVPKDLTKVKTKVMFNLTKLAASLFQPCRARGRAAVFFCLRRIPA